MTALLAWIDQHPLWALIYLWVGTSGPQKLVGWAVLWARRETGREPK